MEGLLGNYHESLFILVMSLTLAGKSLQTIGAQLFAPSELRLSSSRNCALRWSIADFSELSRRVDPVHILMTSNGYLGFH